MKNAFKMAAVRRTAYHKLNVAFRLTDEGELYIVNLVPDTGATLKEGTYSKGPYAGLPDLRKAVRKAMAIKENLSLSFIQLTPSDWIKCLLELDDFLYDLGLDYDSDGVDLTALKLISRCEFGAVETDRVDWLDVVLDVRGNTFTHTFGKINWDTFSLVN